MRCADPADADVLQIRRRTSSMGSSTSTDPRRDLGRQVRRTHRVESSVNFVSVDGSVTEMDADGHQL
jgi:hypothetical protein